MKPFSLISAVAILSFVVFSGCSSVSKITSSLSNRKRTASLAYNPEQMRINSQVAIFQPIVRMDFPQNQGLQTPLVGGRQRFSSTQRPVNLPHFTPVRVLSTNTRFALIELANGQRGFVVKDAIASESSILAAAQAATPVYPTTEPALPQIIDFSDAPVDQAMLNNIDNIPLPESETPAAGTDFQTVDGVMVKIPDSPAAPASEPTPPITETPNAQ